MNVQISLETSKTFDGPFETKAIFEASLKKPRGKEISSCFISKKVFEGIFDEDRSTFFNKYDLKDNFCFISKGK